MIIRKESNALIFLLFIMFFPLLLVIFLSITLFASQLHLITFFGYFLNNIISINAIQGFTTIFISIILEATPFILLGTFISSLIQIFVSEETITKLIPKNMFLGILFAAFIGIIFPVCDCAIVPIVKRLIKKGVPVPIGITFMLSVPIVNPIVLSSTYYAFSNNISMLTARGLFGIIGAITVGSIIGILENNNNILKISRNQSRHSHSINSTTQHFHVNCTCGCEDYHQQSEKKRSPFSLLVGVFEHTSIELHDVGRFLIMGSFLSALMQTFIPRQYILAAGHGNAYSVLIMIALAFFLAVCSETDAFIARTFVGQFTTGSIIAFLIFGPMIDIKNTLMLCGSFKGGFVIKLILVIFAVCFIIGTLTNFLLNGGGLQWLNSIKTSLNGF